MHFYEPIFHPYQLPQSNLYPVTLPLRQRMQDLQRQHSYCRRVEAETAAKQTSERLARQDYTRSVLLNEKVESNLYSRYYNHDLDRQMIKLAESEVEFNYLKKVEDLRRERELLENPGSFHAYSAMSGINPNKHYKDERLMSDDELVHQYDSGYRGKQYRNQIKDRFTATASGQEFRDNGGVVSNLIKNQKVQPQTAANFETADKRSRKVDELPKQSYIDDLNRSYDAHKNNESTRKISRRDLKKGNTIDVNSRTFNDSPFHNTYLSNLSKRKNKNTKRSMNKTTNRSVRLKPKNQQLFNSSKVESMDNIANSAMQKINNRLKVSEIVYKDSKLRHNKHEADHLINTFQNQAKIRKQVKDKFNNHPDILKKHHLVAASR